MKQRLSLVLLVGGGLVSVAACGGGPGPSDGGGGCPDGGICLDAGRFDGGPPRDGAMGDAGPVTCVQPAAAGTRGGRCRMGTTCETGSTCYTELTRIPGSGVSLTLENAFGILTAAAEDPDHVGEYLRADDLPPGDPRRTVPAVPVGAAPGGQCTAACNPEADTDSCGGCSSCSETLGGSPSFGAIGIGVAAFDQANITTDANPGVCRQDCVFDPESNGDCPMGYTCDPTENICVEACTSDVQCNLGFGLNRHEGTLAVVDPAGGQTCNATTGRCEWMGPTDATVGSACEDNTDCRSDFGLCIIGGRCVELGCGYSDPADPTGMTPLYPCATGSICIGIGGTTGNVAGACFVGCNSVTDCPAENACRPLGGPQGGFTGFCSGICSNDGQCHADERCNLGGFQDPTLGTCSQFCTPEGQTPMTGAIMCEAGQTCIREGSGPIGFCYRQDDALCTEDDDCADDQACEVLSNDFYGRCVDGCGADADCSALGAGATCVQQRYCVNAMGATTGVNCTVSGTCAGAGETCRAAQTRGVCRAPAGQCLHPVARLATILQLRGSPQCQTDEICPANVTCMMDSQCTGAGQTCVDGACSPGTCAHCGAATEACCVGRTCDTGLTCNATGVCM